MQRRCFIIFIIFITIATNSFSQTYSGPMIPYKIEDKWGLSDTNANLIIYPKYDTSPIFSQKDSIFFVKNQDGYGIKDLNDNYIFKSSNQIIRKYSNLYIVKDGNEYSFSDNQNQNIFGVNFIKIRILKDRYALVQKLNKDHELIRIPKNTNQKLITIDSTSGESRIINDSTILLYKPNQIRKYTISSQEGVLIETKEEKLNNEDEAIDQYINLRQNNKSLKDSIVFYFSIQRIFSGKHRGSVSRVRYIKYFKTEYQNEQVKFLDTIPIIENWTNSLIISHRRPGISLDSMINYKGIQIPAKLRGELLIYKDASNLYQIVNYNGKKIHDFNIENISEKPLKKECKENLWLVKTNQKWGMMNSLGELIIEPSYDSIVFPEEYIRSGIRFITHECFNNLSGIHTIKNGKHGITDLGNEELIAHEMDSIKGQDNLSYFILMKNSKYGLYRKGREGKDPFNRVYNISGINVHPLFDEQIIGIKEVNGITLIKLGNEEGLFIGYANQNGIKYFK